jgi:hypothetical protein
MQVRKPFGLNPSPFCLTRPLLANAASTMRHKLHVMNSETVNDSLPVKRKRSGGGRAFHSRLEPFVDFIREQRQRRKTWKEIAELLRAEKACAISAQGVHQFCRRYSQRQNRPHWERETANASSANAPGPMAEPPRRIVTASTPVERPFRRPNPSDIKLNDPTNV